MFDKKQMSYLILRRRNLSGTSLGGRAGSHTPDLAAATKLRGHTR